MDVAIWLSLLALAFSEVGAVEFPAAWCYKFGSLCRKFGPQFATCSFTLNDLQRQDKCCAIVKEFCDDNGPKRSGETDNDHKMGGGNPAPSGGNRGKSSMDEQLALINANRETPVVDGPKSSGRGQDGRCYDLATFRKQALDYTNELRALHQAPPLKQNTELQAKAQGWAEKWIGEVERRRDLYLPPHSKSRGVGENIYVSRDSRKFAERDGASGVQLWYDEVKDYNWKRPGKSRGGVIGHFTQLVWVGTTEVGHGFAVSKDCTSFLVVANYLPGGNLHILNSEMLTEENYRRNVKPKI